MSKKILLLLFVVATAAQLSSQTKKEYPTFLNKSDVPNGIIYLPAPPDTSSFAFLADREAYEKGKTLRQSERGVMAIADADVSVENVIACLLPGIMAERNPKMMPSLRRLVEQTMNDAYQAISQVKKHYKRIRPYVFFNEPSGIAEEEESHRATYSYPSAHSAMAWAAALVLTEVFPDQQNSILQRAYELGQSRVIVGYHYQSDVDAARLAASAAVARLHANKQFAKTMRKAKKEAKIRR